IQNRLMLQKRGDEGERYKIRDFLETLKKPLEELVAREFVEKSSPENGNIDIAYTLDFGELQADLIAVLALGLTEWTDLPRDSLELLAALSNMGAAIPVAVLLKHGEAIEERRSRFPVSPSLSGIVAERISNLDLASLALTDQKTADAEAQAYYLFLFVVTSLVKSAYDALGMHFHLPEKLYDAALARDTEIGRSYRQHNLVPGIGGPGSFVAEPLDMYFRAIDIHENKPDYQKQGMKNLRSWLKRQGEHALGEFAETTNGFLNGFRGRYFGDGNYRAALAHVLHAASTTCTGQLLKAVSDGDIRMQNLWQSEMESRDEFINGKDGKARARIEARTGKFMAQLLDFQDRMLAEFEVEFTPQQGNVFRKMLDEMLLPLGLAQLRKQLAPDMQTQALSVAAPGRS
nr:hypothetical protein [Pseudomonadota bacterium]